MKSFLAALLICISLGACSTAQDSVQTSSPDQVRSINQATTPSQAAATCDTILTVSPSGFVRFGPHYFEVSSIAFEQDYHEAANPLTLRARLGETDNFLLVSLVDGKPTGLVQLVYEKSVLPVHQLRFDSSGPEAVRIRGQLDSGVAVLANIEASAGSSTFRLEGHQAFLNGELGSGTYRQVEHLIAAHPEVDTIVFEKVPGSLNDDINVLTGRLIREAGYHTVVAPHGMVASGGVGLFCAGVSRRLGRGARVGVHAWSIPGSDVNPVDLPRNHRAHQAPLQYFREMLPHGEEFYFFTLHAASFAAVHWMTAAEIEKFGLLAPLLVDSDRGH